jgi:hypothetical protein
MLIRVSSNPLGATFNWLLFIPSAGASILMIHWITCNYSRIKAVAESQPKESISDMIKVDGEIKEQIQRDLNLRENAPTSNLSLFTL